jgi:hypothetical protein
MKVVFFAKSDKYAQAKTKVYGDEVVSKASIIIRDNSAIGMKKAGYYIVIDGEDEAVKKAKEILAGLAGVVSGAEEKSVVKAIEEQESSADAGFGAIFG